MRRPSIAYLKQTAYVTIGVMCIAGMGGPVGAEPISGLTVGQTPGDADTPAKWPEAVGSPATFSSDVEDAKDNATAAKPAQEQPGTDRQLLPPAGYRPRKPATPSHGQTGEPTGSPGRTTDASDDWTLNREIKEAVRPLYEELKASGVAEAVRSLKSDLGLDGSSSFGDPASSENAKDLGNTAPKEFASAEQPGNRSAPTYDRPRFATQTEQDKLAAAAAFREFVEELKPWLFGLAGLLVFGYMIKLGLAYFRWAATRSAKKASSRETRSRQRHRRPQDAADKSGA